MNFDRQTQAQELMRAAVRLYPHREYTNVFNVRHLRRAYVAARQRLGARWIFNNGRAAA